MGANFLLTALDFCRVAVGITPKDVLEQSVQLAIRLEGLGYGRYWIAEHHTPDVAHSAPEVLSAIVAGRTSRIRVGPAGILLRYYSPLKIAGTFRLLNAFYPGRIDLGLAAGINTGSIDQLLLEGRAPTSYETKVGEVLGYLRGTAAIDPNPGGVASPEVWILGGKSSARLAAQNATAFCLGLFLKAGAAFNNRSVVDDYRSQFKLSGEARPNWSVAVAGVCADTEQHARRCVSGVPDFIQPTVIGDPVQCRRLLNDIRRVYCTNEIVFLDLCRRYTDKMRSYELLAEIAGQEQVSFPLQTGNAIQSARTCNEPSRDVATCAEQTGTTVKVAI